MFLTILTFITALTISGVAIYYSVAGLAAIFAAAVVPIIIMGGTLEIAKLVVTVWLHRYWNSAVWWLKTYLCIAVLVLMFITSMGIFGFLSKAHIDQTSSSQESMAQAEQFTREIERQNQLILQSRETIKKLETEGVGGTGNIQNQINREQERIESVQSRIQPAIDEQQKIIDAQTKLFTDELSKIDAQIGQLQKFIDNKEVDKAQAMVGTKADGNWGPGTARAVQSWQDRKQQERKVLLEKLEQANNNPNIKTAREEIQRIRKTAETQIDESNKLINRLRDQLGKTDTSAIEKLVNEQQEKIQVAQTKIDELTQQKYKIEGEYRKLEAEVGPVKYLAEFIYGTEADTNLLEKAVSWVIIIIIFVFDPLAVMMLLASQYSYELHRKKKIEKSDSTEPPPPPPSPSPIKNDPVEPENKVQEDIQPERVESEPIKQESKSSYQQSTISPSLVSYDIVKDLNSGVQEPSEKNESTENAVSDETLVSNQGIDSSTVDHTTDDQSRIKTAGVTQRANLFHPHEQYVTYDGKQYSIEALKSLHPELILPESDPENQIIFGSQFPKFSRPGDITIRVDVIPHCVYKFNGVKWMAIDKMQTTTYLQYIPYLNYLIDKIDSGEYDTELLTPYEQEEIAKYLENKA